MTVKSAVGGPSPTVLVAYTLHWNVSPGINVSIVNCSRFVTAEIASEPAVQVSVYDTISPFCSIRSGGDHVKAIDVSSTSTSKSNGGPLGAIFDNKVSNASNVI